MSILWQTFLYLKQMITRYHLLFFFLLSVGFSSAQVITTPTRTPKQSNRYPWHKNITATIFWIGETPTKNNPTPNHASSWDTNWQKNFGGFDDPNPLNRAKVGYRPISFTPKLNPFYIALPYNDRINHKKVKPEAARIIPWFTLEQVRNGKSCLKGRWVQIVFGKKVCFAQWEDCGPFNTTDGNYVFGKAKPKNTSNKNAGIDLSPAIRDFLKLKSGDKVHWRFIEEQQVPQGPWLTYGPVSKTLLRTKEDKTTTYLREMKEIQAREKAERERKLQEYLELTKKK